MAVIVECVFPSKNAWAPVRFQVCRSVLQIVILITQKQRLLVTTDCFLPRWDGIARFLKNILPALQKQYVVTVVAPAFAGRKTEIKGIRIVRVPLLPFRFGDIFFSWFPRRLMNKLVQEADLVFNQTIGPIGLSAIRAASKKHIPIVSYVHSVEWELAAQSFGNLRNMVRSFVKLAARRAYKACWLLLVPSAQMARLLLKNNIRTPKKQVALGIDAETFCPGNKNLAKQKLSISPNTFVVGYHGRIGREKDLPTLVKAFRIVAKEFAHVLLLIVGGGSSLVRSAHNVRITGSTDNVVQYLQAMDAYVLPSLTETSSLATMEAMATGLPVVTTPVGSIPEYVTPGRNGLFVPQQDAKALARQLRRLIINQAFREKLGMNARKTILQHRQWTTTVKKVLGALKSVSRQAE